MTTPTDALTRREPGAVTVLIGFVALIAGRFTLDRAGIDLPLLNDPRVVILWLILVCLAAHAKHVRWAPEGESGTARACIASILLFFGYQAASATWTPEGARLGNALGDLVALAIIAVAYWIMAGWGRDRVVRLTLGCFLLAGTVYFISAASGYGHDESWRWAALGGGPNVFVRVMGLASIAAIYFYCRGRGRIIWLLPIPGFAVGALFSGSRGGAIALAAVAILAIVPKLARLRLPRTFRIVAIGSFLSAGVWLAAGDQISQVVRERFLETTIERRYTSGRDLIFSHSIELFKENPIAGVGLDGFYAVYGSQGEMYPHNLLLSVAAEGGLIGLVLMIAALYSLYRGYSAVPRSQRSLESRAAVYCGLFIALCSMFSGDYYDTRLMWIFFLLAAVKPFAQPANVVLGVRWTGADRDSRRVGSGAGADRGA